MFAEDILDEKRRKQQARAAAIQRRMSGGPFGLTNKGMNWKPKNTSQGMPPMRDAPTDRPVRKKDPNEDLLRRRKDTGFFGGM